MKIHKPDQTKININGFDMAKSAAQLLYGPVLFVIIFWYTCEKGCQGLVTWQPAGRARPAVGADRVGAESGARPARQAGAHQHRHAHQVQYSQGVILHSCRVPSCDFITEAT